MDNFVRVLLVHDARYDLSEVYDALRKQFILRLATNVDDAVEVARTVLIGAVVCASGGSVRAREIYDRLVAESAERAERFVFVRSETSDDDDAVFFLTAGKTWLPWPVSPADVVAGVHLICK